MGKVVLPIRNKSIDDKVDLAKLMVNQMNGDPDFPSPNPTLPVLLGAANDLKAKVLAAQLAKDAWRTALNQRNEANKKLTNLLRQEAGYVESVAGGDTTKIERTGLKSRKPKGASHKPPQIMDVRLKAGDASGEILIRWKALAQHFNLTGHQIRYSFAGPDAPEWIIYPDTTTQSKILFVSSRPGQMVWIEVRAVNAGGAGPWSAVHCIMAPVII